MKFIAIKTEDGMIKGKLAFYCRMLHVSRQGFYKYLSVKDCPWKYQMLADAMHEIHAEDICNDTYGRVRMFQALTVNIILLFIKFIATVFKFLLLDYLTAEKECFHIGLLFTCHFFVFLILYPPVQQIA